MFDNMRRLHSRGLTNRGVCVGADGAMLGPDCVLVERGLGAHRPIGRRAASLIQGLLLADHRDPDWLFEQCGRIAQALDEGQVALAQIYGLHIPIDELSDRRLGQLGRVTAFAKGFNPDEPRIPKGNPHGGEWTDGGDDEGGSGSTAGLGAGGPDGDGDGDGGGDDGTSGGSDGVPTPAPPTDASDAAPQTTGGGASSLSPSGEPAIEYIWPEAPTSPAASSPATDSATAATGTPAPLGSADLDFPVPAAVSATTQSSPGGSGGNEGAPISSGPSSGTPSAEVQPPGPPPEFPDEKPPTTQQVNPILRTTAIWLARALWTLGDLDPEVLAVWEALDTLEWLVEYAPKVISYLDPPRTLSELQDLVTDAQAGYEIHHIVEAQRASENPGSNWRRFGSRIDSRENLVRVPYWKHVEISSWYSRQNPRFGDLSPRDYLRGKSWEEQYEIGLQILRDEGVLQ